MDYMFLIVDRKNAPTGETVGMAEMGQFAGELAQKGKIRGGAPLHPENTATRISVRGGRARSVDGPFAESKEVVGGFFMVDAASRAEAIEIAKRCPAARSGIVQVNEAFAERLPSPPSGGTRYMLLFVEGPDFDGDPDGAKYRAMNAWTDALKDEKKYVECAGLAKDAAARADRGARRQDGGQRRPVRGEQGSDRRLRAGRRSRPRRGARGRAPLPARDLGRGRGARSDEGRAELMAADGVPGGDLAQLLRIERRGEREFAAELESYFGQAQSFDLLGRAALAASATCDGLGLCELRASFLRPAPLGVALRLIVEPLADGPERAFRRVRVEAGAALAEVTASFAAELAGPEFAPPLPGRPAQARRPAQHARDRPRRRLGALRRRADRVPARERRLARPAGGRLRPAPGVDPPARAASARATATRGGVGSRQPLLRAPLVRAAASARPSRPSAARASTTPSGSTARRAGTTGGCSSRAARSRAAAARSASAACSRATDGSSRRPFTPRARRPASSRWSRTRAPRRRRR